MWNYLWPLLLVVGANTFYHICSKGTPSSVQPFATLTVTYLTAAALSLLLFFLTSESKQLFTELRSINWTAFAFGASIIGLEFGYIQLYPGGLERQRRPHGVQHRPGLCAGGGGGAAV